MFDQAAAGIDQAAASFAHLALSITEFSVLIAAIMIATQVGGQGIQKPVRGVALSIGVCALFIKGYITLTTGAMGLF